MDHEYRLNIPYIITIFVYYIFMLLITRSLGSRL
jgi:hypothetical protein